MEGYVDSLSELSNLEVGVITRQNGQTKVLVRLDKSIGTLISSKELHIPSSLKNFGQVELSYWPDVGPFVRGFGSLHDNQTTTFIGSLNHLENSFKWFQTYSTVNFDLQTAVGRLGNDVYLGVRSWKTSTSVGKDTFYLPRINLLTGSIDDVIEPGLKDSNAVVVSPFPGNPNSDASVITLFGSEDGKLVIKRTINE